MITESNEPESNEILGKMSGTSDLVADITDGFACRLDVGALTARRVLEEDYVPKNEVSD